MRSLTTRLTAIGAGLAIVGLATACGTQHRVTPAAANTPRPPSSSQPTFTPPPATTAPPTPAGVPTAPLGTAEEFAGADNTAVLAVTPGRIEVSTTPVDAYSDGPAKGYFVEIHVVAAGLADGQEIDSTEFYVKHGPMRFDEGNGNTFEGPHSGGELGFANLNNADVTEGWLLFDLPSPHGKLAYDPNASTGSDTGPIQYWKF